MLDDLRRDLRFSARSLRRTPAFTIAAVLSIALGIAATTSVFSVVDAALFRRPPLDHPDELAILYTTRQSANHAVDRERWSWPGYRALQKMATSFDQLATFTQSAQAITSGEPEPINAEVVSSPYFSVLRIRPIIGRPFDAADDEPGAVPVALLGYDLWQQRYGGDQSVIGRTIALNGVMLNIVGVMPRGFAGLSGRARIIVPASAAPRISYADYLVTNQNFISVVGRLRPGVTIDRARIELERVGPAVEREAPSRAQSDDDHVSATALSLNEARIDPTTRSPLLLLLAAVGCLLLLSCANVAGLLLGRALSRRREIAIRVATGANRSRIVAQLLAESALLAIAGGVLGVLASILITSHLGIPSASWRGRNFYGALNEFAAPRVDVQVVIFALVVCAITIIAFGLVPALQATQLDLTRALKDGSGGGGKAPGRSRFELRRLIIGAETALAVILLVASGLLASSWQRLERAKVGFDRTHVLTFLLRPSEIRYPPPKAPALIDRVLAEIQRLPSVEAATVDGCAPVGTGCANSTLFIVGQPESERDDAPGVLRHYVGPNHFRTLGIPVLRGRVFTDRDRAGAPRVAIVNDLAAKRFWPGDNPIGKRVWFGGGSNFDRPDSSAEIVGIVGDVAYQSLDQHPLQPDFYTPYAQFTYATRTVLVRTRREPTAVVGDIRRAVAGVDPNLALFDVRAMDDLIGDSWARLSYQTRILTAFALVALLLAATGTFAIVAHVINDRRRELGVRVALGASPGQVLAAVGETGVKPAAFGLLGGVVATLFLARALAAVVYGVRAFDPAVLGGAVLLLTFAIVLAALLAGRRALAINPVDALKLE
jgi:putative ABC transport system permease protein